MGRSAGALEREPRRIKAQTGVESRWRQEAVALFRKDLQAEWRTKTALSSVGVFSFSSMLLIGLATANLTGLVIHNEVLGTVHPAWDAASKMGLLWVLLCFAAFSGLAHSFVHEEEAGTVIPLRMSMSAGAVFAGKYAFNLTLVLGVAIIITPCYMLMTGMPSGPPLVFMCTMGSGCIGLAGAATITGALAAKAHGTGALYGAIGLPLILVFLMLLMNAAGTLYVEASTVRIVRDIGGLVSYGVLLVTVSALTFPVVWEE